MRQKKYIIGAIAGIACLATVVLLYRFLSPQKPGINDLVPNNTMAIYQPENIVKELGDFYEKPLGSRLSAFGGNKKMKEWLVMLDSMVSDSYFLNSLIKGKLWMGLTQTSSKEFDFTYYLNVPQVDQPKLAKHFYELAQRKYGKVDTGHYEFNKTRINEITLGKDKFTYLMHDDFLVGSFASFLIEDVVRKINDSPTTNAFNLEPNDRLASIDNGQSFGILAVRLNKLDELIGSFFIESDDLLSKYELASLAKMNLMLGDYRLMAFGEVEQSKIDDGLLSLFEKQSPTVPRSYSYIPISSKKVIRYGISDFEAWVEALQDHNLYSTSHSEMKMTLEMDSVLDISSSVDGELMLCHLESIKAEVPEYAVIVPLKKESTLNLETLSMKKSEDSTSLVTYFDDLAVYQLSFDNFPSVFLGELSPQFDQTFSFVYDNRLFLFNNLKSVSRYLDELKGENVWTQSVKHNQFLKEQYKSSSLRVLAEIKNSWQSNINSLNKDWKDVIQKNEKSLRELQFASLDISKTNNGAFDLQTLLLLDNGIFKQDKPANRKTSYKRFGKKLVGGPFAFKHPKDGKELAVVQTEEGAVHLMDGNKKVWSKNVSSTILNDNIELIDYFNQGSAQLAFVAGNSFHILDLNGKDLKGFPLKFQHVSTISDFSVIDYDGLKNYRFSFIDQNNDIWLYDKKGKLLAPWNPKHMSSPIVESMRHVRVGDKDCFLVLEKTGLLHLYNRRGWEYKGFPIKTGLEIDSKLFFDRGNTFNTSQIIVLGKRGHLKKYDMKGELKDEIFLYKKSKKTEFSLIPEQKFRTYIIVSKDGNEVSVLDADGKMMFEAPQMSSSDVSTQYFRFSEHQQIIMINDKKQSFSYMYDFKGNLIDFLPLSSVGNVGLFFHRKNNTFSTCYNFNDKFNISNFDNL
ncbi:hypothetical protein [Aureibacter tunicatorum]|uniref:Uncharacterized protein n=1 Tax=Aureibacter tunicatorum TaxID=866807 RepID=A0AAE4BR76_9BACT|nr:hypothetical protein [Aureibacter tunicatorum]MDR6237475.1 hypothetical protein [Aureibacter tunicatorum]BDD06464.1 hypothetical protein AUTU_39470 [Aureibacter tunicatorum]